MADRKARYERRQGARKRSRQESRRTRRRNLRRTLLGAAGVAAALALVIGGIVLLGLTSKVLPPTSFGPGHSESYPPTQINTQPIHPLIQQHVMERGGDHPEGGMLVQYNCLDYRCEPGLAQSLAEIVQSFPPQVYLAPYPGMDAMIALAAPGRLEILDSFDEQRIRQFIERNLTR